MVCRHKIPKEFGDFWQRKGGLTRHARLSARFFSRYFPAHRFPARHEPRLMKGKQNPSPKCTQSEIPRFERETWGYPAGLPELYSLNCPSRSFVSAENSSADISR